MPAVAAPVAQTGVGNVTTIANASNSGATAPISKPGNVADRDYLVMTGYFRNAAGTITPGNGFSLLGTLNVTNETFGFWGKPIPVAASESDTTYTFSSSAGAGRLLMSLFRVTGVNLAAPLDSAGTLALYTGTTSVSVPAVTAVSSRGLLLTFVINNTATTTTSVFTADGAMTEVSQVTISNGTNATSSIQVAQQALSAAGSTGTRSPTISPAASNSGGLSIVLAPAATPAPMRVMSTVAVQRAGNY